MLFLGSKKYPKEDYYADFVTGNGGAKNASTSLLTTRYHFDIAHQHFPHALDIFSQFFKCPLLSESATNWELNAVDSEFKKNYLLDERWINQCYWSFIVKEDSQYNKF